MNTKKITVLFAAMIMMIAMVPMVMGQDDPSSQTNATVNNVAPNICCKWEEPDDDTTKDGIQIMPKTPNPTNVYIFACVCDGNGNDDIASVVATVTDPEGSPVYTVTLTYDGVECTGCDCPYDLPCVRYSGTLIMEACDPAGIYTVIVTVKDVAETSNTLENTFEYLSLKALTIDFTKVSFDGVPGKDDIAGNFGTDETGTITSIGNDEIDVCIDGTDLTDGTNTIPVNPNLEGSLTTPAVWQVIPTTGVCFDVSLGCTDTATAAFRLDIPAGTPSGTYIGSIGICPCTCPT